MPKALSIKLFIVLLFAITAIAAFRPMPVAAATVNNDPIIPLEVEPRCSNALTGQAFWKVTNKNAQAVNIHWTNLDTNVEGDYSANNGVSELVTNYDPTNPNNTTRFQSGPDTNQTNATKAACEPTPPAPVTCIDGSIQQNVIVSFLSQNTVLLTAKDGKTFCDDVTIYFSSYVMPAGYNGAGFFNNPTAYPQSIFSSASVTIHKDQPVHEILSVNLPDNCNNTQVDVYYGPEITTVGANGHGTQNIVSNIYPSTGACPVTPTNPGTTQPQPPVDGGKGAGTEAPIVTPTVSEPVKPVTPATPKIQLPSTLPNTGTNLSTLWAIPAAIALIGFMAAEAFQRRRLAYAMPPNYWD